MTSGDDEITNNKVVVLKEISSFPVQTFFRMNFFRIINMLHKLL